MASAEAAYFKPVVVGNDYSAGELGAQPSSLSSSSSENSSLAPTPSEQEPPIKCSAVHTLERDMPDFDYSPLVREFRARLLAHIEASPGLYSADDVDKCRRDDWHLARFLLRNKLQLDEALDMICRAMRFSNESLGCGLRPEDFPAEFYELGGLFGYEPDRKGNRVLYMRASVHRKTPEILSVVQAYVYYNIKRVDEEANGRGIAIVIDCSNAGLASADMDLLMFLVSTLKNYFPKGLSYFLVHELPWVLKPFWHIAKAWVPDEHRQLIKFSDASSIFEYVARENLPDFMGGTCKRPYRSPPDNCTTLEQAAKLWGIERPLLRRVLAKFEENLPATTVARHRAYFDQAEQ